MVKIIKHDPYDSDHMCEDCYDKSTRIVLDLVEGDTFGQCDSCYKEAVGFLGLKLRILAKVI